jgi:hypothetical protein
LGDEDDDTVCEESLEAREVHTPDPFSSSVIVAAKLSLGGWMK